MVKIMIERSEFGQIGGEERRAVKFSETADFLEESVPVRGVSATISDSKVDEFLHAFKRPLGIVTAAFGEPFCGAVTFTSDVRHLLGKCHFGPSSITESFVLHGYSTTEQGKRDIGHVDASRVDVPAIDKCVPGIVHPGFVQRVNGSDY